MTECLECSFQPFTLCNWRTLICRPVNGFSFCIYDFLPFATMTWETLQQHTSTLHIKLYIKDLLKGLFVARTFSLCVLLELFSLSVQLYEHLLVNWWTLVQQKRQEDRKYELRSKNLCVGTGIFACQSIFINIQYFFSLSQGQTVVSVTNLFIF